jgi:hypothetical protein
MLEGRNVIRALDVKLSKQIFDTQKVALITDVRRWKCAKEFWVSKIWWQKKRSARLRSLKLNPKCLENQTTE